MHSSAVSLLSHLIAEDEADIVVVNLRVHEEGSLEVHPTKPMEADRQPRVARHGVKGYTFRHNKTRNIYENQLKMKDCLKGFEDDLMFIIMDNIRINDKLKVVF